ncbi:hypothetical protein WMY93_019935 [Mugilogobius chulae]|uniref:Nuclear pore complex protein Nup153 n=1 Tax=Mugilogobius chulae TaxID=88201 RepID=A0AAW0NQP5_9GOBI
MVITNHSYYSSLKRQVNPPSFSPTAGFTFSAPVAKLGPSLSNANSSVPVSASVKPVTNKSTEEFEGPFKPAKTLKQGSVLDLLKDPGFSSPVTPKTSTADVTSKSSNPPASSTSTTSSQSQLSDIFKPQPGWSCDVCLVRNKPTDTKCVCCSTPQPNTSSPKPSDSKPPAPPSIDSAPTTTTSSSSSSSVGFGTLFTKPAGTWDCDTCLVHNKPEAVKCVACETAKPGTGLKSSLTLPSAFSAVKTVSPAPESISTVTIGFGDKFKPPEGSWKCDVCMVQNKAEDSKCVACTTPKPGASGTTTAAPPVAASSSAPSLPTSTPVFGFGDKFKKPEGSWSCDVCLVSNKAADVKCVACQTLKPGAKEEPKAFGTTFGSSSTETSNSSPFGSSTSGGIKFGTDSSSSGSGGFKFGGSFPDTSSTSGGFKFGTTFGSSSSETKDNSALSGFKFGSSSEGFKFGTASTDDKKSEEPATSGFKFGNGGGIVFGTGSSSAENDSSNGGFTFGLSKPEEKGTESTSTPTTVSFAPSAEKSDSPAPSTTALSDSISSTISKPNTGSLFGGLATSTTSGSVTFGAAEETPAPTFSFGKPEERKEISPAPSAFIFGGASKDPALAPAPAPAPASTGGFSFGKPPAPADQPAFTFGKPADKSEPTATDPPKPVFSFGQSAADSTGAPKPAFSFMPSNPTTNSTSSSTSTATPSLFGNSTSTSASVAAPSPVPSTFVFGQAATSSTDPPQTKAFVFGQSQDSQPAAPSALNPAPAQPFIFGASANAAPAAPSFNFGGAAPPAAASTAPSVAHHRLPSIQLLQAALGPARLPLSVLHLDPHFQHSLLSLQLLEQIPIQHLCSDRPILHLFLELLQIPHQQVEDFSLVVLVVLAPQAPLQGCLLLVQVQQPLHHLLHLPLPHSLEQHPEDSISHRDQHSTLGQINHSRLLVDQQLQDVGLRQLYADGSRTLRCKREPEQRLGFEPQLGLCTYTSSSCWPPKPSTMNLNQETVCAFTNISQVPAAVRNSEAHLSSRYLEISQWRSQIADCVSRVNQEITLMDQMIDTAESRLAEQQQYSRLVGDCVSLCNSITVDWVKQLAVMAELRREESLNAEVKDMLQRQIWALKDKLNSLKQIRSHLLSDHQDKTEAVKLTSICITLNPTARASHRPSSKYQPSRVSYDHWLNNCSRLKTTADKQVKEASSFRANLSYTFNNVRHTQDCQCQKVEAVLRRAIHNLNNTEETMLWERRKLHNEIADLKNSIQKISSQAQNCDTRLHLTTQRLDILSYRPRKELCVDQPVVSLTLEKSDLTNIVIGLRPVLFHSQQNMELTVLRLKTLEDNLAKNANALDIMHRCLNRHQSVVTQRHTTTFMSSRPRTACELCRTLPGRYTGGDMGCGSSTSTTVVRPLVPENLKGDEDETGSKHSSRGDSAASKTTTDSGVVMENREVPVLPGAIPRKLPPLTSATVSPPLLRRDSQTQERQKSSEILEELLTQGIIPISPSREDSGAAGEAYSIMLNDREGPLRKPPARLESLKENKTQLSKELIDEKIRLAKERRQQKEEEMKSRLRAKSARVRVPNHSLSTGEVDEPTEQFLAPTQVPQSAGEGSAAARDPASSEKRQQSTEVKERGENDVIPMTQDGELSDSGSDVSFQPATAHDDIF